jgi:hypothetical protein
VKTLLGEAVIIASTLIYSSHARKSNLVFVIMDDHRWKPEAREGDMDTLLRGLVVVMELLSGFKKIDFKLQLAWCSPTGGQAIPLST